MATITVPRTDVTPGQVSQALRGGLGPRYHVLPGTQASYLFAAPRPDQPDAIVVGTGSDRLWRTQVRIDRRGGQTHIQVASPSRLPLIWLINTLAITRTVGRVLREAPGLGRPAAGHETDTPVSQ
jgi:hypothetical protein